MKKEDAIKCIEKIPSQDGERLVNCSRLATDGFYCEQHSYEISVAQHNVVIQKIRLKFAEKERENKEIEHRLEFYEVFKNTLQEIDEFGNHHLARVALNEDHGKLKDKG